MLFELNQFISKMVGSVMRLYVLSSSFLTSPPNMKGDLAMDHRVTCDDKNTRVRKECFVTKGIENQLIPFFIHMYT